MESKVRRSSNSTIIFETSFFFMASMWNEVFDTFKEKDECFKYSILIKFFFILSNKVLISKLRVKSIWKVRRKSVVTSLIA